MIPGAPMGDIMLSLFQIREIGEIFDKGAKNYDAPMSHLYRECIYRFLLN